MTDILGDIPDKKNIPARDLIKLAARRLFAARGIDGVTTREIVQAAGQKNQGSLGYYFRTKEELVKEIVVDGARKIDERRIAWLDELEDKGGPSNILEITDILIFSSVRMSRSPTYREDTYTRFLTLLNMSHPEIFQEAIGDEWNTGFQRCADHLRNLMPDMPAPVKNQRIQFALSLLGSVLSHRENTLVDKEKKAGLWASDNSLHHLSENMTAMLSAPYTQGRFREDELKALK